MYLPVPFTPSTTAFLVSFTLCLIVDAIVGLDEVGGRVNDVAPVDPGVGG